MRSVDGFEDTPQYGLFRILDIPLYHAWVLDMNNQVCYWEMSFSMIEPWLLITWINLVL